MVYIWFYFNFMETKLTRKEGRKKKSVRKKRIVTPIGIHSHALKICIPMRERWLTEANLKWSIFLLFSVCLFVVMHALTNTISERPRLDSLRNVSLRTQCSESHATNRDRTKCSRNIARTHAHPSTHTNAFGFEIETNSAFVNRMLCAHGRRWDAQENECFVNRLRSELIRFGIRK